MLQDLGWLKRIKLLDTSDTLINPATDEKLDELKTLLQAIDGHVDGLELTAENVNLNTDTLEAKVQLVRDQLDVLLSTRASEATLLQIRDYVDTIEVKIQSLLDGTGLVKIWDGTNTAGVTATGRLKVSQEPPTSPAETTAVKITEYSIVSNFHDNIYVIPTEETLTIQRIVAGGGKSAQGTAKVEIWYDPNGNGTNMEIIDVLYVDGISDFHDLYEQYIGDGTKAIRLRREKIGGGSVEIFARWEGYY